MKGQIKWCIFLQKRISKSMKILSGQAVSKVHRLRIHLEVRDFVQKYGHAPELAVILVGDCVASQIYVGKKEAACKKVGIVSHRYHINAKESPEKLKALLEQLNKDQRIHGILLQLPLPQNFDQAQMLQKLSHLKDVDGLSFDAIGRLCCQQTRVEPCTPKGVMAILKHHDIQVAGQKTVVIGRSQIVGKPMFHLLTNANATVTLCHSQTHNLSDYTRQADLVVVAAGKPRFLGRSDFKKNSVVIDVGMHRQKNGSLCGDVRFEELEGHVFAATPVPGGVGPMTVTMLLQNTLELARIQKLQ